jgi:hypothetical protein
LSFQVREVRQAGPISYIVKYEADMELVEGPQPVSVEMVNVFPPDAAADQAEVGRQMVQRGAVRALEGTGKSARIRVRDFAIHPVDFHPKRIEEFTYRAVRDALDGAC